MHHAFLSTLNCLPYAVCLLASCRTPKAAQYEGALPPLCVAVEDSASGVGSAFAAEMGLIVGYVGASHISAVSTAQCIVAFMVPR